VADGRERVMTAFVAFHVLPEAGPAEEGAIWKALPGRPSAPPVSGDANGPAAGKGRELLTQGLRCFLILRKTCGGLDGAMRWDAVAHRP